MIRLRDLPIVLAAALLCAAVAYGQVLPSQGGTGAFSHVRTLPITANKLTANVSLSQTNVVLPANSKQPVAYFFLGAYAADNSQAEAGIYKWAASSGWHPFAYTSNGQWLETRQKIGDRDDVQLYFEVLDGAFRWGVKDYTTGQGQYITTKLAGKFNAAGRNMRFYREVSLSMDPVKDEAAYFASTNAKFAGAHWTDCYLYSPAGYWKWSAANTDAKQSGYYPGDGKTVAWKMLQPNYEDVTSIAFGSYR